MIQKSLLGLNLFLLLFATLPNLAACAESVAADSVLTGTVTWVYDGDTLEVDPIGKVRLLGIDCPEHQPAADRDRKFVRLGADPGRLRSIAREALRYTITQARSRVVILRTENPLRDRYGRLLAYVELPDGRLLNRLLLESGLAVVYRRFDFRRKKEFLAAEEGARQTGQGLWAKGRD